MNRPRKIHRKREKSKDLLTGWPTEAGDALVVAASSRHRAHSVVPPPSLRHVSRASLLRSDSWDCDGERPAAGAIACACGGGQEAGCPVLCAHVLRCLGNREVRVLFFYEPRMAGLLGKMDCGLVGTWPSGWLFLGCTCRARFPGIGWMLSLSSSWAARELARLGSLY
jgi:hypothetical protein